MGMRKPGLNSYVAVYKAVVRACKSPGSMKYIDKPSECWLITKDSAPRTDDTRNKMKVTTDKKNIGYLLNQAKNWNTTQCQTFVIFTYPL